MRVLLIDNLDSFTFMLKDYIRQCGAEVAVVRNTPELLEVSLNDFDAVVVSPGPETPGKAGALMPFLKSAGTTKPILGICLGHQALGELYGAELVHAEKPMHGKTDEIVHQNDVLFTGIPDRFRATRYHSLILQNLPSDLQVIASNKKGEVMGVRHIAHPHWGVQFHPESCQTESGIKIIENFLSVARNKY